jgi:protein-disulfide isomerase
MKRSPGVSASFALLLAVSACGHAAGGDSPAPGAESVKQGRAQVPREVQTVALGASPSRGPVSAPVTVVVFSDFQCPFCSRGEATMEQLEAMYPGKIRFVFKNQPLPFHEHARLAARAALAAHEQGKFWQYHHLLFAHQDALDRASLERYAHDVGIDLPLFRAALDSPRIDALIDADMAEAHRLGVNGTPAFFINGRNLQGAQPLEVFRAMVEEVLAER